MGHRRRTMAAPQARSQAVGFPDILGRIGPPPSLTQLGHDPLHLIAIELLRHQALELLRFANVCRDIRTITIPILFRHSFCVWNEENDTVELPPPSLWPYIQFVH
ncbi:hypothetical protein OF83DRAFT_1145343 [Amylostereum chailletii]|nr:hypothetical protein OF83DRAFT_1145343 [Amylostereum chailletii]